MNAVKQQILTTYVCICLSMENNNNNNNNNNKKPQTLDLMTPKR